MMYINFCSYARTALVALSLPPCADLLCYIKVTYLKRMDHFVNQDENQYRYRPQLKAANIALLAQMFPVLTKMQVESICSMVVMHELTKMDLHQEDGKSIQAELRRLQDENGITPQGAKRIKQKMRKKLRTAALLSKSQSQCQLQCQKMEKKTTIFERETADSSQSQDVEQRIESFVDN